MHACAVIARRLDICAILEHHRTMSEPLTKPAAALRDIVAPEATTANGVAMAISRLVPVKRSVAIKWLRPRRKTAGEGFIPDDRARQIWLHAMAAGCPIPAAVLLGVPLDADRSIEIPCDKRGSSDDDIS